MFHISYLVSAFFLISGWCHRYRVFTADVHGGFSHVPQENSFQPKTPHSGFPMPNDGILFFPAGSPVTPGSLSVRNEIHCLLTQKKWVLFSILWHILGFGAYLVNTCMYRH